MTIERIGYGAGRSDFAIPNVTRIVVGSAQPAAWHGEYVPIDWDEIVVLEANIDDMLPQHYELAMERSSPPARSTSG